METMKFILYFFVLILYSEGAKKVEKITNIELLQNCPDMVAKHPNFDQEFNTVYNVTYTKSKYTQVVNGNFLVNNGVKKMPASVILKRCQTKKESSCENFIRMKFNDLCPMFLEKDQPLTPFSKSFSPPIDCPHVKGTRYTITNATVDVDKALKFFKMVPNIFNVFWTVRFEGKSNNNIIWCMELTLRFYEVKERQ